MENDNYNKMDLPVYKLVINEEDETGVNFVSLVTSPAIERDFQYFNKQDFVEPNAGETEDEFIGRCMEVVTKEGYDQDQALAICYNYWEGEKFEDDYPKAASQNAERGIRLNEQVGNDCATLVGKNTGSDDTITHGENNQASAAFVTILGSEGTKVGDEMEYTTAINCTDFVVPEGRRVYVENQPVLGTWLGSGKVVNIDNTDSPYSATYDDWLILCDTTSGNITVTLPDPTNNSGKMYVIKKTQSSHNVTINAGDGSIFIDDATSHTDNAKNGYDQVVSDGTQYWILTHGH